jgi:RNA polymerase sigma-70 factor (ECF subfamily)
MAYKFREFVTQALEQKKDLDPQIVELAKTDKDAFAALYDFYFPKVYAFVLAKTGSTTSAEDIVSDVFMKLLENLHKYQDRGMPFAAWLFTITRNMLFDYYAKQKHTDNLPLEEGIEVKDEKKDFQPASQAQRSELAEQVKKVMTRLPERELSIVQLKFFSGLNNREIAQVLNLTESNVGIILYRVLRKIKPDLNNLL